MGPIASLYDVEKRKMLRIPAVERPNLGHPASRNNDYAIQAPHNLNTYIYSSKRCGIYSCLSAVQDIFAPVICISLTASVLLVGWD
jgi:hypothetical protein